MFYLVVLSLFLVCCKTKGEDVSMWLNRDYPDITNNVWEQIPFFEIKKEYRNTYIEKLNYEKYVILSKDDFYLLTGQILEKKYGLVIRGIASNPDGALRAFKNYKNELDVISYITGKFSSYKKAVLIVEVDEMPEEIYNNLPTENMVRQPPKMKQRETANIEGNEVKYTGPTIIGGGTCTDPIAVHGLQGQVTQE
jgi:hypothetical protein